jgi:NAD(P)-dependent dehydrogenase (short-subunit alcohol dehydrogenase family)
MGAGRGRTQGETKQERSGRERGAGGFAPFDAEQFRGKVVLITGAGRGIGPGGIGYATAMAFAAAGARLAIIGRTESKLKATIDDIESRGGEVIAVAGDVSNEGALRKLFDETDRAYGRLDVLINNAGISGDVRALVRIRPDRFRYAVNVHLHTLVTTRMAARLMRERGIDGTILNVGTFFTTPHRQMPRPYPFRTPYTTAQAWKLEHTRAAAWDLADSGVRVIALSIGPVEGGRIDSVVYPLGSMERGLWGRDVSGPDIRRKTERMHPRGRFLTQEDAARSILTLVSKEMRDSANGSVVELAGGLEYRLPPQVAPPLLGGPAPDLSGRRVLLIGRPDEEQAATLALAFATRGARVTLATPEATGTLLRMAEGRTPSEYGDGQKAILGRIEAADLAPDSEDDLRDLFERLTTPEPADAGLHVADATEVAAAAAASSGAGEPPAALDAPALDAVVVLTGEPGTLPSAAGADDAERGEEERLKQRFVFEPALAVRYALAAQLLHGNRRAGIKDPRFLTLRPYVALLERDRGIISAQGVLQRADGGFSAEEETLLQAGARASTGSLTVVGPALTREEADDAPMVGVLRAGLQAMVSSLAAEMASTRSSIRTNAIFPGADCGAAEASRTAGVALRLVSDACAGISGMIYYPDERNAGSGDGGALAGRTAVVTGGGRNLGQAIALTLAHQGAAVVVAGRGEADLNLTARAIRSLGGRAEVVTADVAFPGERRRIVEAARRIERHGPGGDGVDLWVNNAGIGGTFATLDQIELDGDARWHQTLAINFTGAWLGMVRAILDMRKRRRGGGIVNVSTFYADQPYVFRIPYTVPKILLKSCAALLADGLRPHGISIADVQPSLIDGPRFRWVARNYAEHFRKHGIDDPAADAGIQDWFRRQVPERAPGPADVAGVGPAATPRVLPGSGQSIPVSTLPLDPIAPEPAAAEPLAAPGRTVVIVSTARSAAEIDRTGAFAAWCLESGSRRVVVAADDGMIARLESRLSKRPAGSPWWNLPVAPAADGRLEIQGVDAASPAAIADLFEGLGGKVDAVIYVPGDPEARERFFGFPTDPALDGLDDEAIEARDLEHRRALSLFLDRHVTASLIVARQAARSLARGGWLLMSRATPRTAEATLAAEATQQIVRIAAEEFRLLGRPLHARCTGWIPTPGARLMAYASQDETAALPTRRGRGNGRSRLDRTAPAEPGPATPIPEVGEAPASQ